MSKATKIVLAAFTFLVVGCALLISLFSYSATPALNDEETAQAPGPAPTREESANTTANTAASRPDQTLSPIPKNANRRAPESRAPASIAPTERIESRPMPTAEDGLRREGARPYLRYEEEAEKWLREERNRASVSDYATAGPSKTGDVIDQILAEMDFGNIAFNTPNKMKLNTPSHIQLVVSPTETIEQLKESIVAEGQKHGEEVRISDTMEARLTGTAFQIGAINPERQAVTAAEPTSWKWEIKPTQYGRHNLHLTLSAVVTLRGSSVPRTIRTFERTIEVEVSGFQRTFLLFRENWEWMWTLVVFPLIALSAWLWRRKQNKNNPTAAASQTQPEPLKPEGAAPQATPEESAPSPPAVSATATDGGGGPLPDTETTKPEQDAGAGSTK
jgi:hypothetical protein